MKILFEIDSVRAMYVHAVDTFEIRLLRNHVRVLFCLKFFILLRFYMGILDMLNLVVFCMSDGILSMLGAVYCSAPDLLYVKGCLLLSMTELAYYLTKILISE